MEKAITQSILKQKMDSLNEEIDKFTLCLKSGYCNLSNDIKYKEIARAVFSKYIENPYNKFGNNISLQNGFSFSKININCGDYQLRKDNSELLKSDIDKIVEDFLNNVINEINSYSKDYTFYLIQHSYLLVDHDNDYTYITINISFALNLY